MKNYRAAGSGEPDASFVFLPDGFVREQAGVLQPAHRAAEEGSIG